MTHRRPAAACSRRLGRHPELIASTQMAGSRRHPLRRQPRRPHRRHLRHGEPCAALRYWHRRRCLRRVPGRGGRPDQLGVAQCPVQSGRAYACGGDGGAQPAAGQAAWMPTPSSRCRSQPGGPRRGGAGRFSTSPTAATGSHVAATMWRVQGKGAPPGQPRPGPSSGTSGARATGGGIRLRDGNAGVALSPDGSVLYTTTPLTIHDLASGKSVPVPNPEPVERMVISPDGRLLAAPEAEASCCSMPPPASSRHRLAGNGDFGYGRQLLRRRHQGRNGDVRQEGGAGLGRRLGRAPSSATSRGRRRGNRLRAGRLHCLHRRIRELAAPLGHRRRPTLHRPGGLRPTPARRSQLRAAVTWRRLHRLPPRRSHHLPRRQGQTPSASHSHEDRATVAVAAAGTPTASTTPWPPAARSGPGMHAPAS